ncbi:MAG: 3-isopropylmalate dehydratase small subunit [Desulfobacterales bacterium]|jgi:3-isopropylmalate/(R)-2-methylmalate dehydratase small subunit
MKSFNGNVLFLDRSDINTDEIIPAKYLTEVSKEALRTHLFEDLRLDGFNPQKDVDGVSLIITRANFGCGSSREHAPWALEANGINIVIAESFARIFRQNMFNCGMMAVELSKAKIDYLFKHFLSYKPTVTTDIDRRMFRIQFDNHSEEISFSISDFDLALVKAGGWVEYADLKY